MASLEDLKVGVLVQGILDRAVRVVQVEWHGSDALTLTYTDESGRPGQELLYRDDEARLAVEGQGRAWSMDADGHLFRLVSEARRISLAYPARGSTFSGRTWRVRCGCLTGMSYPRTGVRQTADGVEVTQHLMEALDTGGEFKAAKLRQVGGGLWVRPGGELGLSSLHTLRPQEVAQGGAGLQHARDRLARDRAPGGRAGGSGGEHTLV